MNTVNDILNYLIEEANNFNAGAPWGTSRFANIIIEVVARYYEKYSPNGYSKINRLFINIPLSDLKNIAEKEIEAYYENHTETCELVRKMLDRL